jgi:hypothetical protein
MITPRRFMNKLNLLILSGLIAFACSAEPGEIKKTEAPAQASASNIAGTYKVAKSYPLAKASHGIDGVLQLLQDSRLPKDAYNKEYGTAFSDMNMIDGKFLPLFKVNPPLGAVLRIMAKEKEFFRISESHTYNPAPVAWLEAHQLTGTGRQSFLFTLDESIGMGSYAGPVTHFYDIVDGKLKPIEYLDKKTGKREEMVLMRSLKTGWKLVKSIDGNTTDILHIACRPDWDSKKNDLDEFLVYFDRFHFDGKEWVKYQRIENDFWEKEDEGLPPISRFPAVP